MRIEKPIMEKEFKTFEILDDAIRKKVFEAPLFPIPHCYYDRGLAYNEIRWFITYDGVVPKSAEEFDVRKVLVVSAFKDDHGWRLIGTLKRVIGKDERNREENNETRRKVRVALKEHIRYLMDARVGWAELVWGSKLEKLFAKACTVHEIIDPYDIQEKKLYPQIDVNPYSEFHYACPYNPNGENTWRIAYGHIEWNKQGEV